MRDTTKEHVPCNAMTGKKTQAPLWTREKMMLASYIDIELNEGQNCVQKTSLDQYRR